MQDELSIMVQPVGGRWEVLGAGRFAGVRPENFRATSNIHGSDTCSFVLRRDPGVPIPDLGAFVALEAYVGGVLVWSGRVKETPTRDGDDYAVNVEGQGWQYHLDDDHYEQTYVHSRLSDWKDSRTFPTWDLTHWQTDAYVRSENGKILIGYPQGMAARSDGHGAVGVTLDLGPDPNSWAEYIYTNISCVALNPAFYYYIRGAHTLGGIYGDGNPVSGSDAFSMNNPTSGAKVGAFASPRRYIHIFLHYTGFSGVFGSDHSIRIENIFVYSDNSANFHSGGAPVLKSSHIVANTLAKALPLLSSDNSKIQTTTFSIPDFAMMDGPKTPREVIEAANAFHDYNYMVDVDRALRFEPKPVTPSVEIGGWEGVTFNDASANSGEDLYNKVTVVGSGVDSTPIRQVRYTSSLPEVANLAEQITSPGLSNPDFNANVTGWGSNASLSWVNDFSADGSVGYAQSVSGSGGIYLINSFFTGANFEKGKTYKLTMWAIAGDPATEASMTFGVWGQDTVNVRSTVLSYHSVWRQYTLFWTPKNDYAATSVEVRWDWSTPAANTGYVDAVRVYLGGPGDSLLTRLGMVRAKILPVTSALTTGVADQIGDTYLRGHRTTPFKGSFTAVGSGARRLLGGARIPPAELLLAANQLVRVGHRIDPDTGAWGRDGTMASVSYEHDNRTAEVQIDNQRKNFEAFLERLAVVTGTVLRS